MLMFSGLETRLEKELYKLLCGHKRLHKSDIKVVAPHNRKYLSWFGGCVLLWLCLLIFLAILASMPDFLGNMVTWAEDFK